MLDLIGDVTGKTALIVDDFTISVSALFGEAIRRIHRRESISILFE
jgi:phosphoribosylpyrophosphate synthetase